jgi:hypothetical protein
MEKRPIAGVVDFTDGELTHYIHSGDSLRITRKESKDSFNDIIQLNKKEDFIKVYLKPMMLLSKELSSAECTILFYVLQYLNFTNGMLMETKLEPLRRSTMAQEMLQSERNIDRLLNSLVAHEILVKIICGKRVSYLVNPFIFMRGKMINKTLLGMFIHTKYAKMYEANYNMIIEDNNLYLPEIEIAEEINGEDE